MLRITQLRKFGVHIANGLECNGYVLYQKVLSLHEILWNQVQSKSSHVGFHHS